MSQALRSMDLHKRIRVEAATCRKLNRGMPGAISPSSWPALYRLYRAARKAWGALPADSTARSFMYEGRRYGFGVTVFGRLQVFSLPRKVLLAQGSIGGAPEAD